jgi:hypothetical protein
VTTNEADRTDDRNPAAEVSAPDASVDEREADEVEERDESGLAAEPEPSAEPELAAEPEPEPSVPNEPEAGTVGMAQDDTLVDRESRDVEPRSDTAGDVAPGVEGPLLADATRYQDRWYEIQTGFVDEPRHAVQSASELLTEMMDDLTRRLTTELGEFDAQRGAGEDVSTEDLRVTFQRYRSFFDRLLAA